MGERGRHGGVEETTAGFGAEQKTEAKEKGSLGKDGDRLGDGHAAAWL